MHTTCVVGERNGIVLASVTIILHRQIQRKITHSQLIRLGQLILRLLHETTTEKTQDYLDVQETLAEAKDEDQSLTNFQLHYHQQQQQQQQQQHHQPFQKGLKENAVDGVALEWTFMKSIVLITKQTVILQ